MNAADTLQRIETARTAEDLFGPATTDVAAARAAKRLYRRSAALLHPDRAAANGIDVARATAAFAALAAMYEAWTGRDVDDQRPTVTGARASYALGAKIATGTVSALYASDGDVVVKLARKPTGNPYLDAERDALAALRPVIAEHPWLAAYYPRFVDSARHRAPDGTERRANVLGALTTGFVTLADVQRAYPGGLDGRDWAWMYRRLLRAVHGVHLAGLVHTAITADNVLIHPAEHGVVLAGWSLAVRAGQPLRARIASHLDAYPADVQNGTSVTAALDVYQLHALMRATLAPNETAQLRYAAGCMQASSRLRPSAAQLLDEYDDLIERLYGERTYRPFALPTN